LPLNRPLPAAQYPGGAIMRIKQGHCAPTGDPSSFPAWCI